MPKAPRTSRSRYAALEAEQPLPATQALDETPVETLASTVPTESLLWSGGPVFVGVDGGGSRTRVVLADDQGKLLGRGESTGSNINFVGEAAVRSALTQAWRTAWQEAGFQPVAGRAAWLGLAGVASAGAHETIRMIASQIGLAAADDIGVGHDISVALAGAFAGGPGIALVVGTGSACYGRGMDLQEAQAGGFGPIIDDGGSGYWLGRMALRAAVFEADGRGPSTALTAVVLEALGIHEVRGIAQKLYREQIAREVVAALAPRVIAAAEQRDPAALAICVRGAEALASMVAAVARRLGLAPAPVACIGSAGNHPFYRGLIETAIRNQVPGVLFPKTRYSAEVGALLLAYRQARFPVPAALA